VCVCVCVCVEPDMREAGFVDGGIWCRHDPAVPAARDRERCACYGINRMQRACNTNNMQHATRDARRSRP
jgi:hypothetical protein